MKEKKVPSIVELFLLTIFLFFVYMVEENTAATMIDVRDTATNTDTTNTDTTNTDTTNTDTTNTDTTNTDTAKENVVTRNPKAGVLNASGVFMRASTLVGYGVQNLHNEGIGEIEDLVINFADGRVEFITLGYGGLLEIGDKTFPIPLRFLGYSRPNHTLRLNVDESTLQIALGFDDNWPDLTDYAYDIAVNNFWEKLDPLHSAPITNPGPHVHKIRRTTIKMSTLFGHHVINEEGEELGEINDLLIDLGSGKARYALLGSGGLLDLEETPLVVPLAAFTLETEGLYDERATAELFFNIDEKTLQVAPSIKNVPDLAQPNWDAELRRFWQEKL